MNNIESIRKDLAALNKRVDELEKAPDWRRYVGKFVAVWDEGEEDKLAGAVLTQVADDDRLPVKTKRDRWSYWRPLTPDEISPLDSSKPRWVDLPDWVQWMAQDGIGEWYGYSSKPTECVKGWGKRFDTESITHKWICDGPVNPAWRSTLERRPE
jgi:hypothetical protein